MQITHTREKSQYNKETESFDKPEVVKTTFKNIHEVTNYAHLQWNIIYWADGRNGPRAYAFDKWATEDALTTLVFESANEMARFKEDLRLQEEEHARASKSS